MNTSTAWDSEIDRLVRLCGVLWCSGLCSAFGAKGCGFDPDDRRPSHRRPMQEGSLATDVKSDANLYLTD